MKTKYKKLNSETEYEKRLKNLEETVLSLINVIDLQSKQIKYIIKKFDDKTKEINK